MKTTHPAGNLLQLTRLWAFNAFLVREADGFTLVDTGLSGSADSIIAAAAAEGLPIVRILLTHAHGDHIGSLDDLAQRLPDAEVLFTERTARFLEGDLTLEPHEPQAELRGSFENCATQATRLIAPGDRVGSLRVIAAPGHTPDHVAFLDERDGTLIAGDAFQTRGGVAVAGDLRWRFPFPAMATWQPATALETAQQLRSLNPERLAVGHGNVLQKPARPMAEAIARLEKKLDAQKQTAD